MGAHGRPAMSMPLEHASWMMTCVGKSHIPYGGEGDAEGGGEMGGGGGGDAVGEGGEGDGGGGSQSSARTLGQQRACRAACSEVRL